MPMRAMPQARETSGLSEMPEMPEMSEFPESSESSKSPTANNGRIGAPKPDSEQSSQALFCLVYEELRRLAGSYLRRERTDHTLQPTALVHEAFVKLTGYEGSTWRDRQHFFAVAARAMRQVLVDSWRRKNQTSRGGGLHRVNLDGVDLASATSVTSLDFGHLEGALRDLERTSPELGIIVELRFFAGLQIDELATHLGVSTATISRRWRLARARLHHNLRTPSMS